MTFSPVRKSGKRNIFMTTAITPWAQGILFANLKDIDLTDDRIELYRLYNSRLLIVSTINF